MRAWQEVQPGVVPCAEETAVGGGFRGSDLRSSDGRSSLDDVAGSITELDKIRNVGSTASASSKRRGSEPGPIQSVVPSLVSEGRTRSQSVMAGHASNNAILQNSAEQASIRDELTAKFQKDWAMLDANLNESRSLAAQISRERAAMKRTLEQRRAVVAVLGALLLGLEIFAAHAIAPGGLDAGGDSFERFAFASEVTLVGLAAAAAALGAGWLPLAERHGRYISLALRSLLLWGLCFVLSVGAPSRRGRLLGVALPAGLEDGPCEEAVSAQWVALALGFAAVFRLLPFALFAPISQAICAQHLVLGIMLKRPECETAAPAGPAGLLLGQSPTVAAALQLHMLAAQFAVASWRCSADADFAEAASPIVSDAANIATMFQDARRGDEAKNGLELIIETMRQEELSCLRVLVDTRRMAPLTEASCVWVASISSIVSFISKVALRLQTQASALRTMGGDNVFKMNRYSVQSAPGDVYRKGIQGFIQQCFMAETVPDDLSTVPPSDPGVEVIDDCGIMDSEAEVRLHETMGWPTEAAAMHAALPSEATVMTAQAREEQAQLSRANLRLKAAANKELNIGEWRFDALKVEKDCGSALLLVGHEFLSRLGHINRDTLVEFLCRVESGYVKDNPYHTSTHAADVCNAMAYMVKTLGLWDSDHVSDTKKMSMVLAALGHDLGHFGRNNHFLIGTRHELATTYNDRSVLENFHTASLFRIMDKERAAPGEPGGLRILEYLGSDAYSKARATIVALILATDTQSHLEALASFRLCLTAMESASAGMAKPSEGSADRLGDASGSTFDPLSSMKDQQEALSLIFRAADIGHSAKAWHIHEAWSALVSEEFHRQGDEETRMGVPISPLCDRKGFKLVSSQTGFLQFICLPTWTAIARFESLLWTMMAGPTAAKSPGHSDNNRQSGASVCSTTSVAVSKEGSTQSGRATLRGSNMIPGPLLRGQRSDTRSSLRSLVTATAPYQPASPSPGPTASPSPGSIAACCLGQCESNFRRWKDEAEALKAAESKKSPTAELLSPAEQRDDARKGSGGMKQVQSAEGRDDVRKGSGQKVLNPLKQAPTPAEQRDEVRKFSAEQRDEARGKKQVTIESDA